MKIDVEKIVREYIDKSLHMSLATSANSQPWVCEVHFVYDNELNLYWRSLRTRRHSLEIDNNPKVAGNIVKQHTADEYPHAIYFEGMAAQISDVNEIERVFPLFQKRLGLDKSIKQEASNPGGKHFYRVAVTNWYAFGKFGGDDGLKHELIWNGAKI